MIIDARNSLDLRASRLLTPRELPDIVDFLEGRTLDLDGNKVGPLQLIDKDDPYRGPFTTENCPDLREILRSGVSPKIRRTIIVGPTQSFKTSAIIGIEAYTIAVDHGPVAHVLPAEPLARSFSQKRFQMIVDNTPWLAALKPKNPDAYKDLELGFTTCTVRFAGSNSPGNLASFPYRRVIGDETDKFPQRLKNEAGTRELLQQRTGQFTHFNQIDASTPTVPWGTIWQAALIGDCRRYYVPCFHCGKLFTHRFTTDGTTLVWDQGAKNANGTWDIERVAKTAHYRCPHCQNEIWENHRRDMLHAGQWIPDPKEEADARRSDYELVADPECRSYFRSCFNVLHPNRTYAAIAVKHLLAGKDPSRRQNFTNSELGEVHEEGGEAVEAKVIYDRREDYLGADDVTPAGRVMLPEDVRVITAAVDVQAEPARCEFEIVGWGAGMESWGIQYGIVEKRGRSWPEVFEEVDRILSQPWLLPIGSAGAYMELQPAAICWDTGHETEAVYKFVKKCQPRRVYAVKGATEGYGAPLVSRPAKSGVKKVTLYQIGTVTAKCEIYSRLRLTEHGAGMMHFPKEPKRGYDIEYFRQITAEKQIKRWSGGRMTIKFIKPGGRRNEALDIRCYNRAALHLLDPVFEKLDEKVAAAAAAQPEADPTPPQPPPETVADSATVQPAAESAEFNPSTGKIEPAPAPDAPKPNSYEVVAGPAPEAAPRPTLPRKAFMPRRQSWAARW